MKPFDVTEQILFGSREESKVVGVCVNTKKPVTLDSSFDPTIFMHGILSFVTNLLQSSIAVFEITFDSFRVNI